MSTDETLSGRAGESEAGSAAQSDNKAQVNTSEEDRASEKVKNPEGVLKENRRLLSDLKKLKEEREQLSSRLEEIEQNQLAAAGKKDELISALKTQVKERDEKLKKTTQGYAMRAVNQQVAEAAREMGCDKPELIMKLADLSEVPVSDDFTVDRESLRAALERVKADVPALFKKTVSAPRDGTPTNDGKILGVREGDKDFGSMTLGELKQQWRSLKKA